MLHTRLMRWFDTLMCCGNSVQERNHLPTQVKESLGFFNDVVFFLVVQQRGRRTEPILERDLEGFIALRIVPIIEVPEGQWRGTVPELGALRRQLLPDPASTVEQREVHCPRIREDDMGPVVQRPPHLLVEALGFFGERAETFLCAGLKPRFQSINISAQTCRSEQPWEEYVLVDVASGLAYLVALQRLLDLIFKSKVHLAENHHSGHIRQ